MNRRFSIFILLVNLFATAIGIWTVCKRHPDKNPQTFADLKSGLSSYLAKAPNPEEFRSRSAEMVDIMGKGDVVVQDSRILMYRFLKYIILLSGFNVVCIALGLWTMRSSANLDIEPGAAANGGDVGATR